MCQGWLLLANFQLPSCTLCSCTGHRCTSACTCPHCCQLKEYSVRTNELLLVRCSASTNASSTGPHNRETTSAGVARNSTSAMTSTPRITSQQSRCGASCHTSASLNEWGCQRDVYRSRWVQRHSSASRAHLTVRPAWMTSHVTSSALGRVSSG